jgi:hypothetical protein
MLASKQKFNNVELIEEKGLLSQITEGRSQAPVSQMLQD